MKNNYYIAFLLLLIWGCANRIQPTGGPKDEDPPKLIASSPQYGQRNYHSLKVEMIFDEFIKVKSLKEQLIITPRITGDYEFSVRKYTIALEFDEPFDDSTTYTLNYREGIVDITEGNPAENLILAFSTGNMLDTLAIAGNLVDLMTKAPINAAVVGLYPIDDTLDIFSGPPYYFTQTNKSGDYLFQNIKDGEYRLYAFEDENKNLTCESDREGYAFLAQTIILDTAYVADTLHLQHLNIDTLKVTRTRSSGRYFNVFANKYITHARLRAENDSIIKFQYFDEHKGLKLYNTFKIKDSLKVFVTLKDSLDLIAQDSFYLKYSKSERKPDEFKISFKEPVASLKRKKITGKITFNKPLQKIILDSISIKRDTLEQYYVKDAFNYALDSLENILSYSIDIPQAILDTLNTKKEALKIPLTKGVGGVATKAKYILSVPAVSFLSIEYDSSVASSQQIKLINIEDSGLINGAITTTYNSFTIQLLDDKMEVAQEHQNGKAYTFDEILPGDYYIRILVDENDNGKWEMAYIRQNIPAEKVILYKDDTGISKTVIRANWEVTIDLIF